MEKIIKKDFKEQHMFFVNEKDSPHLIEKLINKLKVFIEKNKSLLPDLVKIDKINIENHQKQMLKKLEDMNIYNNDPDPAINIIIDALVNLEITEDEKDAKVEKGNLKMFLDKKFPKCKKHNVNALYVCIHHLDGNGLMCNECIVGGEGHEEKELDKHEYFFAPNKYAEYLIKVGEKLLDRYKINTKMSNLIESSKDYSNLLEYNVMNIEKIVRNKANILIASIQNFVENCVDKFNKSLEESRNLEFDISKDTLKLKKNLEDHFYNMIFIFYEKLCKFNYDTNNVFISQHRELIEGKFINNPEEPKNSSDIESIIKKYNDEKQDGLSNIIPEFFRLDIISGEINDIIQEHVMKLSKKSALNNTFNIVKIKNEMNNHTDFQFQKFRIITILENLRMYSLKEFLNTKSIEKFPTTSQYIKVNDNIDKFIPYNRFIFPQDGCFVVFDEYLKQSAKNPMIISIGGLYKINENKIKNNYFSVLDINTYTYYRNIYDLRYYSGDQFQKFDRIGCKAVLLDNYEQNILKESIFTIAIFGGIDIGKNNGYIHTDIFLLSVHNLLIKDNLVDLGKKPSQEKIRPLEYIGNYDNNNNLQPMTNFEILKMNGKIYIFGGITSDGEIKSSIYQCIINYSKDDVKKIKITELKLKTPLLFGFTIFNLKFLPNQKENYKEYCDTVLIVGGYSYTQPIKENKIMISKKFPDDNFEELKIDKFFKCNNPRVTNYGTNIIITGGTSNKATYFQIIDLRNLKNNPYDLIDNVFYNNTDIEFKGDEYKNILNYNELNNLSGYNSFNTLICTPKFR